MQTRRNFLTQAAKVLAGGIVAASGILAIVPAKAKAVFWLPTPEPTLTLEQEEAFGRAVGEGIAKGIRAVDDHTVSLGDYTPLYWPDKDNYGGYIVVGEVRGIGEGDS